MPEISCWTPKKLTYCCDEQFLPKTCGGNAELVPIQDAAVPSRSPGSIKAKASDRQGKQADSSQTSSDAASLPQKAGTFSMPVRRCYSAVFFVRSSESHEACDNSLVL